MSKLRDGARKLLDASIHAVHCMNSMRTAPDGVPDGIYTFRLFAAMDALETAINECGPALSEPDPRDIPPLVGVSTVLAEGNSQGLAKPEEWCRLERDHARQGELLREQILERERMAPVVEATVELYTFAAAHFDNPVDCVAYAEDAVDSPYDEAIREIAERMCAAVRSLKPTP